MRTARVALALLGSAAAVYGVVLAVGLGPAQLAAVLLWVVGGVLVHDALLAPVVVGVGVLTALHAPPARRVAILLVAVVLGPLTLVAVPVLGRFGARPDNPTLLDRPYWLGYLLVVATVLAFAVVAAARPGRADGRRPSG